MPKQGKSKDYWPIEASIDGSISEFLAQPNELVEEGAQVIVLESMKLFFYQEAPGTGYFFPLAPIGTFVHQGQLIGKVFISPIEKG